MSVEAAPSLRRAPSLQAARIAHAPSAAAAMRQQPPAAPAARPQAAVLSGPGRATARSCGFPPRCASAVKPEEPQGAEATQAVKKGRLFCLYSA